jgi:hypothetical protein
MIADGEDYQRSFRIMMLVVGLAMLGWGFPYGVANYQLDHCSEDVRIMLNGIKGEIAKKQSEIDSAKKVIDQK